MPRQRARAAVEAISAQLHEINDWMSHNPEIGFAERGAAAKLTEFLEDEGFGVERGVGGKVIMVEHGLVQRLDISFTGRTAQPAGSDHEGVSAFEAAILTWTNINATRQYLRPDFYVHGVMGEGGFAANVIPDRASLVLYMRAPRGTDVDHLVGRVTDCAKAAAMTVGATVTLAERGKRFLRMVNNPPLAGLPAASYEAIGREVSPPTHGPEFAPHTITGQAHRAIDDAAQAMALTCIELFARPELVEQAKAEFAELMREEPA